MREVRLCAGVVVAAVAAVAVVVAGAGCGPQATWNRDVAPLVERHCARCHGAPGSVALPLLSYEDAAPQAGAMADAVASGAMPPWPAAGDCGRFREDPRLSLDDKDVFRRFAAWGAPRGDGPPRTALVPHGLARVDVLLAADLPYTPEEDADDFHCSLVLPGLAEDGFVAGLDVVPGDPQGVREVLLLRSGEATARRLDDDDPGPGWRCQEGTGADINDVSFFAGWFAGMGAVRLSAGTGLPLAKGEALVMRVHYRRPSSGGGARADDTLVLLQLADQAVRPARLVAMTESRFIVPAQAEGFAFTYERAYSLEAPSARLHGVAPLLHDGGRAARLVRIRDGERTCLLDVDRYDRLAPVFFTYADDDGVELRRGDSLEATCIIDNPSPSPVGYDERESGAVCIFGLYLTEDP